MKHLLTICLAVCAAGCAKVPEDPPPAQPAEMTESRVVDDGTGATVTTRTFEKENVAADVSTVTLAAEVKKVDLKQRMITLKSPQGNDVSFKVAENVKRLNEIKVGDSVVVDYLESVLFEAREPTEEEKRATATFIDGEARAPKDLPPGLSAARSLHGVVTIVGIDQSTNVVTVKQMDGRVVSIKARYPERLKKIKVGDTVAFTYTEAVAVSVEPLLKPKKVS